MSVGFDQLGAEVMNIVFADAGDTSVQSRKPLARLECRCAIALLLVLRASREASYGPVAVSQGFGRNGILKKLCAGCAHNSKAVQAAVHPNGLFRCIRWM